MKGISNLIAAVLLLAVTISVVSIFARWAPGVVTDTTDSTGEQVRSQVDCNAASLSVEGARYYTGENTTVVVRNTGRTQLDFVQLEAYDGNLPMNSTEVSVAPGKYAEDNVTTKSRPSKVRAISANCTSASDTLDDIQ